MTFLRRIDQPLFGLQDMQHAARAAAGSAALRNPFTSDLRLLMALVGLAACLCASAVSFDGGTPSGRVLSFGLGFTGLCVLMLAASIAPIKAMSIWGAIYVPASGLWLGPALEGGFEVALAFAMLSFVGMLLYGGTSGITLAIWRCLCPRLNIAHPVTVAGAATMLAISVTIAEHVAAVAGLVLAPIGLLAVFGGHGWIIAGVGVFATSGCLMIIAAGVVLCLRRLPALSAVLFAAVISVAFLPGPPLPAPPDISIIGISHDPDPHDKWTPNGSVIVFERLVAASDGTGADLVVWPENALTATFDLDVIAADPPLGDQAHLFGMTRFASSAGPNLVNSAVLIEGDTVQVSDKVQLAPIIERSIQPLSQTDLISGTRRVLFMQTGTTILPLLCYEIAFPLTAHDLLQQPDIIIVLAAETGFWHHMTAAQAERHARARELETGIRVLRVSDRKG